MEDERITVTVPQVKDLGLAIQLYYRWTEIGNEEIRRLFGVGSNTALKLKKAVWEKMVKEQTPVWDAKKVNTEVAYQVWGLDIASMERRYEKLKKLGVLQG